MEDQLLDYDHINKKKLEIQNWISIILIWACIVASFVNGLLGELYFLCAVGLLLMSTIFMYFNPRIGVRLTLLLLFLAAISLISFSPMTFKVGITFFEIPILIDLIPIIIGVVHYFTNKEYLISFFRYLFGSSNEDTIALERSQIDGFKMRFSRLTIDELKEKVASEMMTNSAKAAAQELLDEKLGE